ncbi:MAG: hypothetical protein KJO85_10620, partial [Gammaproteobacteria bacterium]|nr:hypothetical protein [Gammaproteobacteria bacterium]
SNANGTTVYRVTPQGQVSVFATGFNGASGNVFDTNGNMLQANIAGGRIDSIAPNGTVSTIASSGFTSPVGVAIDSGGNTFVANCGGGGSISRIQGGVGVPFVSGAPLNCPNGLTIDPDDNLYTANFNDGNIVRITPGGAMSILATTPNSSFRPSGGNGHITYGNGRLYVVGNASAQIFELTLDGQLTLIAGNGTRGHDDGPALQASFSSPNGISLSADGRFLYVNEAASTSGTVLVAPSFPLNPSLVRVIDLGQQFSINVGINGAWADATTPGQGMFFDVLASLGLFFMGWFTYETNQDFVPVIDDRGRRWLVALGPINGNVVNLELLVAEGGQFDQADPVTETPVGSAVLTFASCTEATFEYQLDNGLSGTIPLTRLLPDVYCALLNQGGS